MYYLKFNLQKLPFRKDNFAAIAIGPIILVKNYYKNNKGLINHEKFHVKMFWIWYILSLIILTSIGLYLGYIPLITDPENIKMLFNNLLFQNILFASVVPRSLLYKFVPRYRLWEEVKAYKIQEKTNKQNKLEEFAYYLATYYDIDISEEEALKLLKK